MICFRRHDDAVDRLGVELIKGFRAVGINVPSIPPVLVVGHLYDDIEAVISHCIGKAQNGFGSRPDLILFLLQGASVPLYTALKHALDISEGIASQVMVFEKACKERGQAQYIANVSMKVGVFQLRHHKC